MPQRENAPTTPPPPDGGTSTRESATTTVTSAYDGVWQAAAAKAAAEIPLVSYAPLDFSDPEVVNVHESMGQEVSFPENDCITFKTLRNHFQSYNIPPDESVDDFPAPLEVLEAAIVKMQQLESQVEEWRTRARELQGMIARPPVPPLVKPAAARPVEAPPGQLAIAAPWMQPMPSQPVVAPSSKTEFEHTLKLISAVAQIMQPNPQTRRGRRGGRKQQKKVTFAQAKAVDTAPGAPAAAFAWLPTNVQQVTSSVPAPAAQSAWASWTPPAAVQQKRAPPAVFHDGITWAEMVACLTPHRALEVESDLIDGLHGAPQIDLRALDGRVMQLFQAQRLPSVKLYLPVEKRRKDRTLPHHMKSPTSEALASGAIPFAGF